MTLEFEFKTDFLTKLHLIMLKIQFLEDRIPKCYTKSCCLDNYLI